MATKKQRHKVQQLLDKKVRQRERLFLLVLFLVALAPRLLFVYIARYGPLTYDEADYDMLARNLALGHGYVFWDHQSQNVPVTFRPPGFPFFISLIYRFFDGIGPYYYEAHQPAVIAMRVTQALLGAFVPILTYFVAKHIFSRRVAVVAGIIMGAYTTFIFYASALMTENLYIPTLLVALLLLLKSEGKRPFWCCILGAFVMGLAIHIRPELIGFLPFLLLWFYIATRDWRQALMRWGVVAAIIVLMVIPWSVRNYRVADQFIFLDARTGYNLFIGYREGATGTFDMKAAEILVNELPQDRTGKWEIIRHNWGKEQALKFIREHPGRALALLPLKFMHFWDLDKREYLWAYSNGYIGHLPAPVLALVLGMVMLPFAVVVVLGVIGVSFTRPLPAGVWMILLLLLLYTIGHTLVFGEPRMHMPLVPFIAVLAAQGLVLLPCLWRYWRHPAAGDAAHESHAFSLRRTIAAALILCCFLGIWSCGLYLSWHKFEAVFGPNGHQSQIDF